MAAALGSVFFATLDQETRDKRYDFDLPDLVFGDIRNVHKRVDQLLVAWNTFAAPYLDATVTKSIITSLNQDLDQALKAVRGWAARRNDLAHGYVTIASGPDYSRENQPIIVHYALCPSHARVGKWFHGEPEYNYIARDITAIAKAFLDLDANLESIAARIEKLRLDHPIQNENKSDQR